MNGSTSRRHGYRRSIQTRQRIWRRLRYFRTAGIGLLLAGMVVAFALVLAAQSNAPAAGPRPGIAQGGPQWVTLTFYKPRCHSDRGTPDTGLPGRAQLPADR